MSRAVSITDARVSGRMRRALHQLHLDLAPPLQERRAAERLAGNGIVGNDGEHGAIGPAHRCLDPRGPDPRNRLRLLAMAERLYLAGDRFGHVVGALRAASGLQPPLACGLLEVPARLVTAGRRRSVTRLRARRRPGVS
jgi:hypothetical protein